MAKKEDQKIERTYNIPLRREYLKVAGWKRTNKAVIALRQFLVKHMKSENIKLSKEVNEEMWKHGIKNPPHHIKVNASKDSEGVVKVDLFGKNTPEAGKKENKKVSSGKDNNSGKDKKNNSAGETPAKETEKK